MRKTFPDLAVAVTVCVDWSGMARSMPDCCGTNAGWFRLLPAWSGPMRVGAGQVGEQLGMEFGLRGWQLQQHADGAGEWFFHPGNCSVRSLDGQWGFPVLDFFSFFADARGVDVRGTDAPFALRSDRIATTCIPREGERRGGCRRHLAGGPALSRQRGLGLPPEGEGSRKGMREEG
jgi:hypothetical protein